MNIAWYMFWGGSRSTKPCVFLCKVASAGDERCLVCAAGAAGVELFLLCVLQRVVVPVCVVLCDSWISGYIIALEWLHECCMGYVLGRKPEYETLCFSVKSGCSGEERCLVCAAGAAGVELFLLCVLQRVVVPVCVVLCDSWISGCMIALAWLHECYMGYILGRKPEHETLCFSG